MMRTYNSLGVAERNIGRLAEARSWYEKSHQMAVELKDPQCIGAAAQNIGVVCQIEGDVARQQGDESVARHRFEAALLSVGENLRITQSLNNQPGEASACGQLAQIHLRLGEFSAAENHAHQARDIHETLALPGVFKDYHTLSKIAKARGDTAAAAEWAHKRDAKIAELNRLASGEGT